MTNNSVEALNKQKVTETAAASIVLDWNLESFCLFFRNNGPSVCQAPTAADSLHLLAVSYV